MNTENRTSENEKLLWLRTLDPVHVGAGGTRLSHVDNEIVRDPGDSLPKIPATTISGNIRTGAARYWQNKKEGNPFCAGVGGSQDRVQHCGACPVCHGFGTSREGSERMGALSFADALLLLFPLYSHTHGPIWVTSHSRRQAFLSGIITSTEELDPGKVYATAPAGLLALGRRLAKAEQTRLVPGTGLPDVLAPLAGQVLAVVPDDLFSRLVNENLEVRTSVSIDPLTGTAKPGALFTCEALPRASILLGRVTLDGHRWGRTAQGKEDWPEPFALVEQGAAPLRLIGLGGMTTRGFGRVEIILEEVAS